MNFVFCFLNQFLLRRTPNKKIKKEKKRKGAYVRDHIENESL